MIVGHITKAECRRIDAFELWCWRRLLRVPWTARRSNQSIQKEISPECLLEGLMLKLKLQYFGHLMQRADSLEKTLIMGKTEGRRRRGWQRMRLLDVNTDSTWVWASPGSWWWTGNPGVLQYMGSQRVGHDWATELIGYFVLFLSLNCKIQEGRAFSDWVKHCVSNQLLAEHGTAAVINEIMNQPLIKMFFPNEQSSYAKQSHNQAPMSDLPVMISKWSPVKWNKESSPSIFFGRGFGEWSTCTLFPNTFCHFFSELNYDQFFLVGLSQSIIHSHHCDSH